MIVIFNDNGYFFSVLMVLTGMFYISLSWMNVLWILYLFKNVESKG